MTDIEDRLKRLLNEAVDTEAGDRYAPASFHAEQSGRLGQRAQSGDGGRRPRPWLLPLAAAACVATIIGIGVAAVAIPSHSARPAHPALGTSRVGSSSPPSSAPSSAPQSSAPQSSSTSASASGRTSASRAVLPPVRHSTSQTSAKPPAPQKWTTQRVGNAQIAVPPGWEVRVGGSYAAVAQLYQWEARQTYCLAPRSLGYGPRITDCPILLAPIDFPAPDDGSALAPDDPGGLRAKSSPYCGGGTPTVAGTGGERDFGSRGAEYRRLSYRCPGTANRGTLEQYEVLTRPAYLVVGQVDQPGVQVALDGVVSRTTLPPQDHSLRLWDYGYVRKVTQLSGGVEVQLQRIVRASGAVESSTLYRYVIPQETLSMNAQNPAVGKLAEVYSDGTATNSVGIKMLDRPPAF